MEAAIRVVNWIQVLNYCSEELAGYPEFMQQITESILIHGSFIADNLEIKKTGLTTNHTTANMAGLLCVSLAFPDYCRSPLWRQVAMDGLESCLDEQIMDDGSDFEASTGYHRFVLDIVSHSLAAATHAGISVSCSLRNTLGKMHEALSWMVDSAGNLHSIGDNDNGMWLTPDCCQSNELQKYLIEKVTGQSGPVATEHVSPRQFDSAGFCSSKMMPFECFLACFPIGQAGLGGHNHEDLLQLCISLNGVPLVVDGGTGSYNRSLDERLYFRSRKAHSIPFLEDTPSYFTYRSDGPFDLDSFGNIHRFMSCTSEDGFHELTGRVTLTDYSIERTVSNYGNRVEIIDHFRVEVESSRALSQFIINPAWEVTLEDNHCLLTHGDQVVVLDPDKTPIELTDILWSPSYDCTEKASCIRIGPCRGTDIEIRTVLNVRQ